MCFGKMKLILTEQDFGDIILQKKTLHFVFCQT